MPRRLAANGLLVLSIPLLVAACRSAAPADAAKGITATLGDVGLVPPPRLDEDPTAVLEQRRDTPSVEAEERARADRQAPVTSDPAVLARFYHDRGLAAGAIGRVQQWIDDLKRAVSLSERVHALNWDPGPFVLDLARAELQDARRPSVARRLEAFMASNPRRRGQLITATYFLVTTYVTDGHVDRAERTLRQGMSVWRESLHWRNQRPEWRSIREAQMSIAEGRVLGLKGQLPAAMTAYRRAIAVLAADPVASAQTDLAEVAGASLAGALATQGALAEAEVEARRALLSTLRKRGGDTTLATTMIATLASVLFEGGRYGEAETLARAGAETLERIGTRNLGPRRVLVRALVAEERWDDALREYDAMRTRRWNDDFAKQRFFADPEIVIALLVKDRVAEAVGLLRSVVDDERRRLRPLHPATVVHRALLALAGAAQGNREAALRELREVTPVLLDRGLDIDDETTTRAAADRRREFILSRYIRLLAERAVAGGADAVDAVAEAFKLAEAMRGRSVARALDASAARNATPIPGLAELVRRSQDAKKHVETLYGHAVNILSARPEDQDNEQLLRLRTQIEALQRARQAIDQQIAKEYPAYAQLMNPTPGTLEQVRAMLRPGEALVSTLVTEDHTFVWAVPREGAVAFAAPPRGAAAMQSAVARLRRALDPDTTILSDIPAFDLDAAYDLYLTLLEPVKAGWIGAETLLIVPHGALGQLPFALLPTEVPRLAAEEGPLFSRYRSAPWLVRSHATVVLPSAGALLTLRSMAAAPAGRRPFIGFGDPYFTEQQARGASDDGAARESSPGDAKRRRLKSDSAAGARLADLPPLPDTAEEIRAIAATLHADPTRDIFLGERANERAVLTADLASYAVVAFATHGLVPGDLDGLTQPALALTAPEIAGIEGDGLLTMEKILGLRLDADWIVLSACNTASGNGAGSDAISGLGRAFFYAGARALLVTSWPVETTSARALTTELFRRQQATPGLSRARALQQTMLALMDGPGFVDEHSGRVMFSYAHPIFWAPFMLVGDGG